MTIDQAQAQTCKKVADANKITVSCRPAPVLLSDLIGSSRSVGFSVELTEAVMDDGHKKLNRPNLAAAAPPVTSKNRIALRVSGIDDMKCGSIPNNAVRAAKGVLTIRFMSPMPP